MPKPGSGKIPDSEQINLEPELEEALKNATDAEMCDIAGETNTHTFLSSKLETQYLSIQVNAFFL